MSDIQIGEFWIAEGRLWKKVTDGIFEGGEQFRDVVRNEGWRSSDGYESVPICTMSPDMEIRRPIAHAAIPWDALVEACRVNYRRYELRTEGVHWVQSTSEGIEGVLRTLLQPPEENYALAFPKEFARQIAEIYNPESKPEPQPENGWLPIESAPKDGRGERFQITQENCQDRIEEAIHTIIHCWDDWNSEAGQSEQVAQSVDAWFHEMEAQLRVVIEGMLFDEPLPKGPTP